MNILTTNRKSGTYGNIYEFKEFLKKSLVNSDYELEWIYGSHPRNSLNKSEFLRVLNFCRQNYKFSGESNNLDIRSQYIKLEKSGLSNIRCSISGVQNIKKYCKTNSILDIPTCTFMKKSTNKDDKKFNQIINTDYNFRVNLKNEILLDMDDPEVIKFKDNLKDSLKYYRYKKRFSFKSSDNLFRIDITAVKSNSYNPKKKTYNLAKNLVNSRVLTGKEIYELEIEYIGNIKINNEYPIVDYSKRVFSDWESQNMSDEDYEAQMALSNIVDSGDISFSPEGSNYYLGDINDGYSFLSDYQDIDSESTFQEEVIVEPRPTMNTPWSKAAALSGEPMNLIYMNYWYPDNQWLFWLIKDNKKELLFEGVLENYTDDYEGALENSNYVKYIIYPPVSEEDKLRNDDLDELYRENLEKGFDGIIKVPFQLIYGLEEKEKNDDLKAGSNKMPSWAPKINNLTKDNRFIDLINVKFGELIGILLNKINDNILHVSKRKCENILNEYKTLTEQNSENIKFVGPQPVSMSLDMLNPDNPHSILKSYVVTEKADGIRAELFIDKQSEGYLITQKKEIIYTGCTFKGFGSSILDGEYITKDREGNNIKLFMIFDIYYLDNGDYPSHPYTYPWLNKKDLPSRYKILHDFQNSIEIKPSILTDIRNGIYYNKWDKESREIQMKDTIRIGYKKYYDGPKKLKQDKNEPTKYTNIGIIGKMSQKILDLNKKNNYEYNIDGLIFMPMNYPVSSDNEEFVVDNIGVTWYQNYKWKPPEENTIDFRIEFVKEEVKGKEVNKITSFKHKNKTIQCQQVNLYVGYDINKDVTTDFTWKVMGYNNKRKNEILFNPPTEKNSIHICNIPLTNSKLLCLKDKTILQDKGIYEMKYEPNNPFGYQWIPLRERSDKIRPNNSHTADNVWRTIQYPVLEKYITGKDLNEIDFADEKEKSDYYIEDPDSDSDKSLRNFHNYIKDKLIRSITSIGNKSISILDTSIGRGGDLNKYLRSDNDISFLLGLDISNDINKCAKRYYLGNNKTKALFLQYDTGKSIKGGEGCVGDYIDRNKLLIDILYDRQKALPKELRPLVPKYKGLCKKGFDIISSQFSIHYYFKDELTLRTYIQNISENIKKGGYFIGTCYDGMKVFQLLEELENNHLEMLDEYDNKIYSITKKYDIDDFTYNKDNIQKLFGQQIDVYMNSIGQTIPEYLVNFQLLIEMMKEYDLILVKPEVKKNFKGFFDNDNYSYMDGFGGFELIIKDLENLYSKDTSLKKYFPEAFGLLKDKNKPLRDLSGLNNWFIFQKV
tara:strand:+ start:2562 stop:6413 length:3852 start_codon:yes stop_codon:yes gene_type:complete